MGHLSDAWIACPLNIGHADTISFQNGYSNALVYHRDLRMNRELWSAHRLLTSAFSRLQTCRSGNNSCLPCGCLSMPHLSRRRTPTPGHATCAALTWRGLGEVTRTGRGRGRGFGRRLTGTLGTRAPAHGRQGKGCGTDSGSN